MIVIVVRYFGFYLFIFEIFINCHRIFVLRVSFIVLSFGRIENEIAISVVLPLYKIYLLMEKYACQMS